MPWRRLIDQSDWIITIWLATRPLAWLLYIWVVYAILHKVMDDHPGILRTSRRIFAASFVCAVGVALVSARIEYAASAQALTVIAEFVTRAMIIERACITTSLILLAVTLAFLLWFPVQVSRNIACLCAGLLAYFAAATAMLLLRDVLVDRLVAQFEYDRGFSSYRLSAALASLPGHARGSEEGNTGSYLAAAKTRNAWSVNSRPSTRR